MNAMHFSRRHGLRADGYIESAISGPYRPSVTRAEKVMLAIALGVLAVVVVIGAASWLAA